VTGSASDSVATFRVRPAQNEIVFIESETSGVDPEDGGTTPSDLDSPIKVAVSPDESHVYVGTSLTGLALFDRSPGGAPTFGQLGFVLTSPGYALREAQRVAVSPDGRHLVVATLEDDSLHSLARDPQTGSVSYRDTETQGVDDPSDAGPEVLGLEEPQAVAFSPDGRDVYVSDLGFYSISLYQLDPGTGELSYRESEVNEVDDPADPGEEVKGLYEPWDLVVSPDGESVYSAGSNENTVSAFRRDQKDGSLSFVEAETEGVGEVEGLEDVRGLAVSPDGASLYATAYDGYAAAVFARDPATGELAFLESEELGADDPTDAGPAVEGLEFPHDAVVSRDGEQVYFGGEYTVTRFDRDPGTGRISFAEVEREGVDDPGDPGGAVESMREVQRLELSRDGRELYVASTAPAHSLTVFARSPQTGALSYLETERDLIDDPTDPGGRVEGLRRLHDLAISPDDRHLYAVSEETDALAIFSREDDFDAPDTTITEGPGENEVIADSTPTFTYASSEPLSTFGCEVDGAPSPCLPTLGPLGDGLHTFSVAATDPEENTDPSPATRSFTVDTLLVGGKVKAGKKQRQKGRQVVVKLTLTAAEAADGTATGKVLVGKRSYRLKPLTRSLQPGTGKQFSLKPVTAKQRKKIVAALRKRGKKRPRVSARLTGEIVDQVGNAFSATTTVRLTAPRR
jgi:6-phosphogluconolactonase (cycloisomerase 2 family)